LPDTFGISGERSGCADVIGSDWNAREDESRRRLDEAAPGLGLLEGTYGVGREAVLCGVFVVAA